MFKNYKLLVPKSAFILFLGFLSTKIISGSYFVLKEASNYHAYIISSQ